MSENIYGPGGLPIILSQYLKQTPDTNDTIDIATVTRRYRDVHAKRIFVDEAAVPALAITTLSFPNGQVAIGDETTGAAGIHAVCIGAGAVNPTPHTVALGCGEVTSVYPNSAACDLGTTTAPFKRCKLSEAVETFCIGNSGSSGVATGLSLGDDAVNGEINTVLIGDPLCGNIRPNNHTLCDIGTHIRSFKDIWMFGDLNGPMKINFGIPSTIVGQGASAGFAGTAVGGGATCVNQGVAVGVSASSTGPSVAVGKDAVAGGGQVVVGHGSTSTGGQGVNVIGTLCNSLADGAAVFGSGMDNSEIFSLLIGSAPGAPLRNIRSYDHLLTDLGTPTRMFKDVYFNHTKHPTCDIRLDQEIDLVSGAGQDLLVNLTPSSTGLIPGGTTALGDAFLFEFEGFVEPTIPSATGTISIGTAEEGAFIDMNFQLGAITTHALFKISATCRLTSSGIGATSEQRFWINDSLGTVIMNGDDKVTAFDASIDHTLAVTFSSSDVNKFFVKNLSVHRI